MDNITYLNFITSEHRDKPNYIAWVTDILSKIDVPDLISAFDIDTAVGAQLDILGLILGRKRLLNFQPGDGSSPLLDDESYRLVLKSKILMNQWNGTIEQLYSYWSAIFPNLQMTVADQQDMSYEINIVGISTVLEQELIRNGYIVPKPFGVNVNYIFADIIDSPIYFGITLHEGIFETITQTT